MIADIKWFHRSIIDLGKALSSILELPLIILFPYAVEESQLAVGLNGLLTLTLLHTLILQIEMHGTRRSDVAISGERAFSGHGTGYRSHDVSLWLKGKPPSRYGRPH